MITFILIAFILAACIPFLFLPLARRWGLLDIPDGARRLHAAPMPLIGGPVLWCAMVIPFAFALLISDRLTAGALDVRHFLGWGLGGLVLCIGGALDDRWRLPPARSFVAPVLACGLAVLFGVQVATLTNPFGGALILAPALGALIAFCWLLFLTYAVKLADGADGVVAGTSVASALAVMGIALSSRFFQPDVALAAGIVAAAAAGFFFWNLPPARAYLGEGGSTLLGFSLAMLAILGGSKTAVVAMSLGLPLTDAVMVAVRRMLRGARPWVGDRTHLHHLLLDAGVRPRTVCALYVGASVIFGGSAVLIPVFWGKLVTFAGLSLLTIFGILFLERSRSSSPSSL